MTTAAVTADAQRRPSAVRALIALLQLTAATTVAVEALNYWYAPEHGFGLAVRTGWAMLRVVGFLILVWHVRRGRAGVRPLGLILVITTVFAVGRLIVPRTGVPHLPGLVGFAILTGLGCAVVWLLYRSTAVAGYLVRHPRTLVLHEGRLQWRETPPRRPELTGWLWTARVAAFTYTPLMLVPCLIAVGERGFTALPLVALWFVAALATSWAVLFTTFFLLRSRAWARRLLVSLTGAVLLVDLPLCWVLLGVDGLVRDGAPLVAAAALALYSLWRAPHPVRTASFADAAVRDVL